MLQCDIIHRLFATFQLKRLKLAFNFEELCSVFFFLGLHHSVCFIWIFNAIVDCLLSILGLLLMCSGQLKRTSTNLGAQSRRLLAVSPMKAGATGSKEIDSTLEVSNLKP